MTTSTDTTSVMRSIVVDAPVEHAFRVFTEQMSSWWDPDHHLLSGVVDMVVEPFVGGSIIDRTADGTEQRWARVLAYDPPSRFGFSWDITLDWKIQTDYARSSDVEVTFTADGPDRTTVVLTHQHLDRHGSGWEAMRDAVGSGWDLTRYAQVASGR